MDTVVLYWFRVLDLADHTQLSESTLPYLIVIIYYDVMLHIDRARRRRYWNDVAVPQIKRKLLKIFL